MTLLEGTTAGCASRFGWLGGLVVFWVLSLLWPSNSRHMMQNSPSVALPPQTPRDTGSSVVPLRPCADVLAQVSRAKCDLPQEALLWLEQWCEQELRCSLIDIRAVVMAFGHKDRLCNFVQPFAATAFHAYLVLEVGHVLGRHLFRRSWIRSSDFPTRSSSLQLESLLHL